MKHETANANTTEQYGYTESYLCRIRVTLSVRGNLLASGVLREYIERAVSDYNTSRPNSLLNLMIPNGFDSVILNEHFGKKLIKKEAEKYEHYYYSNELKKLSEENGSRSMSIPLDLVGLCKFLLGVPVFPLGH